MDHENRDFGVLRLMQHAGVKVMNLAVLDGGVRHIGGMVEDIECGIE